MVLVCSLLILIDSQSNNLILISWADVWKPEALLYAGGADEMTKRFLDSENRSNGSFWGSPPYGDQPDDQFWINQGIQDYLFGIYW